MPLRRGDAGLDRDSVVKCEEVSTVVKSRLRAGALGGPLSRDLFDEIRACLLRALDFE